MDVLDGPRIEHRDERRTLGIRRRVPFRGMLAERDRMLAELVAWFARTGGEPDGPFFLRLHTVDMAGEMDIEVGAFVAGAGVESSIAGTSTSSASSPSTSSGEPSVGAMPAGDYAVLTYRNHSLRANRLLLEWAQQQGTELDVTPSTDGDRWAGRFEIYLTDPRTEPRKTQWTTQLAFRAR
jgi:hypothetical protein